VSFPATEMARLRRRAFGLEYATMTWMVAEAAIAITAGAIAASIALIGFGLDSVIELFSAGVVIWQLRGEMTGQDRQTRATRLIGGTFFALAAYLAAESIRDLAAGARPGQSVPGRAVAAAALIVMPVLAMAKRRTGQALGNRTLVADSAETALCALTSAAALLGVALSTGLGWRWADPAGALIIAVLAAREGIESWQEEQEP
jgi:divalent metal cation (Fe/Co/Zn/Cd) transporter